jgi:hypothetical protein
MRHAQSETVMRTILLLSAMLLAIAAPRCLAQSQGDGMAAATVDGVAQSPARVAPGIEAPVPGAPGPKSAFGRVMAVLIAKLVQDSAQASQPRQAAGSDATATLPIDIEVGAAFRRDTAAGGAGNADAPGPAVVARPGGSDAGDAPSQPEPLALRDALPANDGP